VSAERREVSAGTGSPLTESLERTLEILRHALGEHRAQLSAAEIGWVTAVGEGVARIGGLPGAGSAEIVAFPEQKLGMALNLLPEEVAVVLLDSDEGIEAGDQVRRTGRVLDVPVGDALLGRVLDPLGRPLDESGPIRSADRRPIEREAPGIMDRAPVTVPLQTRIQVIDALIPIGRGQRELILGDRQTGKTALALDTVIHQRDQGVICVYCAIGQRTSSVAGVAAELRRSGAMDNTVLVVAPEDAPPGLRYACPYAATSIAEFFAERGDDALIVYDDLTRHARAYRELSLLLRRPPAREAYPGDIFYIHSRLLERSTHLREELGGGSLTALPIIETQAENESAYIPTNLISITDGQIFLSGELFAEAVLPAVDVGRSVSRVGGKTQLPAYRDVSGDLRLAYSQYRELEAFARFGTRLDEETRQTLTRGRRVREVLKQDEREAIPVIEQIGLLVAVTEGLFDEVGLDEMATAKRAVRRTVAERATELAERIHGGEPLRPEDRERLADAAGAALEEGGEEQA
jgi:F-type H+-transporting ATPase subunit alpha